MIALLDVNVLVALFDPSHPHHDPAHQWLAENRRDGWATCPLTENGLVRILCNPKYPGRQTSAEDATDRLDQFLASGDHTFWPDSVSLRDPSLFKSNRFGGHGSLTDLYLLGLAVRNRGRLVTFDQRIQRSAVIGAEPRHLEVLDG